jgi:superfamily II DNA or RNA helicase
MWCDVDAERFIDLQPLLEFPNPEHEKQRKLIKAGIMRWAAHLEPTVRLYRTHAAGTEAGAWFKPRTYSVPMGAAWCNVERDDALRYYSRVHGFTWLMDHQKRAAVAALRWRSGVIVAPCGAGKTQVGVALHAASKTELPTLVIVHTRDLALQWAERVERLLGIKALKPVGAAAFGKVADGAQVLAKQEAQGCIVVTTVQTLTAVADLHRYPFGLVILDEAHHAPASMFQTVLGAIQCQAVYGLTATPERSDGWTPAMYAWLGPKRHEVYARDLQAIGLTLAPRIVIVKTGCYATTGDFTEACTQLAASDERNAIIAELVETHGEFPQLVLTSRIEHAEELAKVIPNSIVVTGRSKLREKAFADIRGKVVNVLIATQLADEGLDLPGLVAVHLTMPSRAEGRVVQRVGRVMRAAPGKGRPTVYDYVDDMGLFESQARARMKAYRELGNVAWGNVDRRRAKA